jgi:glutamate N-acetyltransferase/amino-acid N-acetyltransferase
MKEFNSPEAWGDFIKASTTIPEGFRFATAALEFLPKERPAGKPYPMRLSLIVADQPTTAFAGVFTKNAFPGAPVLLNRELMQSDQVQAVLINNKISNVGSPTGLPDARALATEAGRLLGIKGGHVMAASTGIIGWSLPVPDMVRAMPGLVQAAGKSGPLDIARAIMTTDSYPKAFCVKAGSGHVFGIAKGAGMIEPNMATMLVFLMTDLDQPRAELQASLGRVVEATFNCISVDSDQSTSDMAILLSSQKKPRVPAAEFEKALFQVCEHLATHVVRNGEGTAHVMRVTVSGLGDDRLCREAAKAIVNSPLVKTAVYGNDPNVGRLMAALGDFMGNQGHRLDASALSVSLCAHTVFDRGVFQLSAEGEVALSDALKLARQDPTVTGYPQHDRFVDIEFKSQSGAGSARVLGSDLGYEYVKENADYRS